MPRITRILIGIVTSIFLSIFMSYAYSNGIIDLFQSAFEGAAAQEAQEDGSPLNKLDREGATGVNDEVRDRADRLRKGVDEQARSTAEPKVEVNKPGPVSVPDQKAYAKALATLATLPVKGKAPKTGYEREQFGQAWTDDVSVPGGHNGCDTRNDILGRDLKNKVYKPFTRNCVVLEGDLDDLYTGKTIHFVRGQSSSMAVQIDHVIALSNAWQTGAQAWDIEKRKNFANDPLNLMAADGPANSQKGDGDAATWLPPNKPWRPMYCSRMVDVRAKYGLFVTTADRDALQRCISKGLGS